MTSLTFDEFQEAVVDKLHGDVSNTTSVQFPEHVALISSMSALGRLSQYYEMKSAGVLDSSDFSEEEYEFILSQAMGEVGEIMSTLALFCSINDWKLSDCGQTSVDFANMIDEARETDKEIKSESVQTKEPEIKKVKAKPKAKALLFTGTEWHSDEPRPPSLTKHELENINKQVKTELRKEKHKEMGALGLALELIGMVVKGNKIVTAEEGEE